MQCPTCQLQLTQKADFFTCTSNCGMLISPKQLREHDSIDEQDAKLSNGRDPNKPIRCPSCTSIMDQVNYNGTGIIIESCGTCHYKWLDSGELTKIQNYKPDMSPEDLFFLLDTDGKMQGTDDGLKDTSVPGYAQGYVGGVGRSLNAGKSHRTVGWMGAGFVYGSVRTLLKGSMPQRLILLFACFLLGVFIWLMSLWVRGQV